MLSTITSRGQTVIPADIRKRFGLSPSSKLVWVVHKNSITVKPVAANPIAAFRGSSRKEGSNQRLLAERAEDINRE